MKPRRLCNELDKLPTVTLYPLDGPPNPPPEPEPPAKPMPSNKELTAEERRHRSFIEATILKTLAERAQPMSVGEICFLSLSSKGTQLVREACERLVAEGRLVASDSRSSFTKSGTIRHYALAPKRGAEGTVSRMLSEMRNGRKRGRP